MSFISFNKPSLFGLLVTDCHPEAKNLLRDSDRYSYYELAY